MSVVTTLSALKENSPQEFEVDGIHVPDRTDDDVGLQFGFHAVTLRSAAPGRKSAGERRATSTGTDARRARERMLAAREPDGRRARDLCRSDNRIARDVVNRYHRRS